MLLLNSMSEDPIPSPMQQDDTGTVVETSEVDLEKVRDEKCFPVARKMFNGIADKMIPEDANIEVDYNPVVTELLQIGVDADLNLTTEVPYVFQTMKGIFSALNVTVQDCDTVPIDEVRYATIGRKILQIVNEANVSVGDILPEQSKTDFAPVKDKINALFAEEQVSLLEVKYIMDNIFQSFTDVENHFMAAVQQSVVKIEEKLMGVDSMTDVSMGLIIDIQNKLATDS